MTTELSRVAALPSFDAPYTFGHPAVYLNTRELARVLVLRSKVGNASRILTRRELNGRVVEGLLHAGRIHSL